MARLRKADSGAFWFYENGLDLFFLAVCSLLMSAESPSHTHGQTGDERRKILHEGLGNVQPVLNANEKKKRERSPPGHARSAYGPRFVGIVAALVLQQTIWRAKGFKEATRDSRLRNS